MKSLYKQAQERLKYLEEQEETEEIKIRKSEMNLVLVVIQQRLLGALDIPHPPLPPLSRHLKEGCNVFCPICGSTRSRKGFLGIFGKRSCDNPECVARNPEQ